MYGYVGNSPLVYIDPTGLGTQYGTIIPKRRLLLPGCDLRGGQQRLNADNRLRMCVIQRPGLFDIRKPTSSESNQPPAGAWCGVE